MAAEPLQEDSQILARQLVEKLRQDIGKPVERVPRTRSIRFVYWSLGMFAALVLGSLEVAVLLEGGPAVGAHPSTETVMSYTGDVCAQRQREIMRAIGAYTRDHGEAPKALAALAPSYLSAAPVDPVSGQPYRYLQQGKGASIACPNSDLHKSPSRAAQR